MKKLRDLSFEQMVEFFSQNETDALLRLHKALEHILKDKHVSEVNMTDSICKNCRFYVVGDQIKNGDGYVSVCLTPVYRCILTGNLVYDDGECKRFQPKTAPKSKEVKMKIKIIELEKIKNILDTFKNWSGKCKKCAGVPGIKRMIARHVKEIECTEEEPAPSCDKPSQEEEQRYEVSNLLLAALWYLRRDLEICQLNRGIDSDDPFGNNAAEFKNDTFHAVSYDWVLADQGKEQEYNFKWRDIKIWWYKYLGRDTECNKQLTNDQIDQMLEECLESLNENESEE